MNGDRILARRRLLSGWFSVDRVTLMLDDREIERDLIVHVSGAVLLPYDPARQVALMVSETRLGVLAAGEPDLWEGIAGALDGETPEACARREALEEGGLALHTLEPVGTVWATPSSSTEQVHLFLAPYAPVDRVGQGGGLAEEGERLEVREVPLAELGDAARSGRVRDAKTLMLVQALMLRRPDLF